MPWYPLLQVVGGGVKEDARRTTILYYWGLISSAMFDRNVASVTVTVMQLSYFTASTAS
jgi:hypothetical protein